MISNLSLKLKLPPVRTIYPVVSIKQLEPNKPEGERKLNDEPPPIVEGDKKSMLSMHPPTRLNV